MLVEELHNKRLSYSAGASGGPGGPGPLWGNFGPLSYDFIISKEELMSMLYSHYK